MGIEHLHDDSVLRFYENIRGQVEAERRLPHKFMRGDSVKQYAATLLEELIRRRLQHNPIDWRSDR